MTTHLHLMLAALFAEGRTGGFGGGFFAYLLMVVGMWAVFTKAGEAGWKAIIPIYNIWVLRRVGRLSWLWFVLFLIPPLTPFVLFYIIWSAAERFGKGFLYSLGLFFLPFLFYPMLGFGSSTYRNYP